MRIQEVERHTMRMDKTLKGLSSHGLNFFSFDKWTSDLIGLLEIAIEDEYNTIDYFVYEIDFGKKGKDCITDKDGTKHSLTTIKELYWYILERDSMPLEELLKKL